MHFFSRIDLEQHRATCSGLVLHCKIVKEMQTYLDWLSSGGSILSRAYDVIHELFRSKHESQTLAQFYTDFNKLFEEVEEIVFPIRAEVEEM